MKQQEKIFLHSCIHFNSLKPEKKRDSKYFPIAAFSELLVLVDQKKLFHMPVSRNSQRQNIQSQN